MGMRRPERSKSISMRWDRLCRIRRRFARYSSRPSPRLFVGDRISIDVTSRRSSRSRISTEKWIIDSGISVGNAHRDRGDTKTSGSIRL